MKTFGLIVFIFSLSAFANNPQERACRLTGGLFHAVHMDSDQVGFCAYGPAFMDSLSIMDMASLGKASAAVQAFKMSPTSCDEVSGTEKNVTDLEGDSFRVCAFDDLSAVEVQTLEMGPAAPENAALVKALQVRY
jgi:hypothetical protein